MRNRGQAWRGCMYDESDLGYSSCSLTADVTTELKQNTTRSGKMLLHC